jgi:hypothetical protein
VVQVEISETRKRVVLAKKRITVFCSAAKDCHKRGSHAALLIGEGSPRLRDGCDVSLVSFLWRFPLLSQYSIDHRPRVVFGTHLTA